MNVCKGLFLSLVMMAISAQAQANNQATRQVAKQSRFYDADFRAQYNLVDGPKFFSDSGVNFPPYASIQNQLQDTAAQHPDLARVIYYGKTPEGRDLTVIRIGHAPNPQDPTRHFAVQISGAIHGNEYLGIEDLFASYFLDHMSDLPGFSKFIASGGVVYIIPIVNPDGYEARQRSNSMAIDLNRDFDQIETGEMRFTQPESKSLAQYLENDLAGSNLQLRMSLDYHCCVPAMITPVSYMDAQPKPADQPAFNALTALQTNTLGFDVGNPLQTVGYLADGTTIDYFYSKWGTLSFAIEGRHGGEAGALLDHVKFFDQAFMSFVSGPAPDTLAANLSCDIK